MNIRYIEGNLFNSDCQTIVNTVNCVGAMGKGIALVFRLRFPKMYERYRVKCQLNEINIGKLWLYRDDAKWVLNFPTKNHWRYDSKISFLEEGLQEFLNTYHQNGITSVAFPLLGSHNGGLDPESVESIMVEYLSQCEIPIEIYRYNSNVTDGMFEKLKDAFERLPYSAIKEATALRRDKYQLLASLVSDSEIKSMISLVNYKGLGLGTLQKCFNLISEQNDEGQLSLFTK
ncbi:macro domain-containing protein [Lewinella sp. 4G2]|uniref:macro domain-containing protein n=1 Tax=Lewinella sp. 4G2 TaxID=1803372 RepID=UPI0007B496C9|nr:macro domain-containing protein [Lewinella sp. 4G2]OAV44069.1 Appr-1-p processing protein [Lewinella sp. 4G2]